jgi:hypothetical protein
VPQADVRARSVQDFRRDRRQRCRQQAARCLHDRAKDRHRPRKESALGLQQRQGHPVRAAQGARRVRAGARLWAPARRQQLQRRQEEGHRRSQRLRREARQHLLAGVCRRDGRLEGGQEVQAGVQGQHEGGGQADDQGWVQGGLDARHVGPRLCQVRHGGPRRRHRRPLCPPRLRHGRLHALVGQGVPQRQAHHHQRLQGLRRPIPRAESRACLPACAMPAPRTAPFPPSRESLSLLTWPPGRVRARAVAPMRRAARRASSRR